MDSRTEQAQSRLQQGTYSASGEVLDYTLYDSQILKAAILQHRFFVQGLGKPNTFGAIKTLADSNVISEGMPQGQKFTVKAIKLFWKSKAVKSSDVQLQAIVDVLTNSVATFKINGKDVIFQATLQEIAGNNFPVIHHPTVAGDNANTHMMSIVRTAYPLNIPIVLSSLTHYEILLEHFAAPAAGAIDDYIMFSLQGGLERLA